MKYRVRMDLSFDSEAEARELMDHVCTAADKSVSINEGSNREEISFCDLELCGHDEGMPCTRLERKEVKNL